MTKTRGGGAAADVPLPWRGCDASRDGRGERSEPDEHARSRRARRRAVRGGSRTGFHHLRSGQLRHQSHVWICKRPPSIMVMLAVHVPVKYTFAPYLAYIRQIRETWIHSWVIRPERTSGSRSHFLTKPTTCSTLFPNHHLPDPIARLRRIRHDAPSQTLPSDALYWPCAR